MSEVLQDLSAPAMSRAIRNNLYTFFRHLRHSPHIEFNEGGGLIRWHSAVPHPWFNGVLSTRPPAADETQSIQEIVAFFRSRNVPLSTWWIEAEQDTAAWERQLLAYGFGHSPDTPGMAVDLYALNENVATPGGFRIVPVQALEAVRIWSDTFTIGYELPEALKADLYTFTLDLGIDLPIRSYVGYLKDRPVATSGLFLGAGVAGVYSVSTLPEARRQGIGAVMSLAPLQDAREMGYRVGVLQSSPMGFHVYKQLGFQHLCNLDNFYWKEP
jgi:GNAT superfamily N-acetyltransferase